MPLAVRPGPGDQALAPVAQFLCKKHGYQAITFEIVVDPEVLGGFVLEIDRGDL